MLARVVGVNDRPVLLLATLIAVSVLITLFAFVPPASAQQVTGCPKSLDPTQFVWGLPEDDPDGGLAKHAGPVAHSEQLGVFEPRHARVSPAGRCRVASNGSTWVDIWNYPGSSKTWVNSDWRPDPFRSVVT